MSLVSVAIRSTSWALKSVVGIGSSTKVSETSAGTTTSNFNLATLETSLPDAEKARVVRDDDWNDGNPSLDCEMKGSLFEWQHDWTVGV